MKELLFTNWHAMRIFRLAFAVFLCVQAYNTHELFFIIFGLFFLIQAIFNSGCGKNRCAIPKNKQYKK
jgi:hypothetical protein